MTREVHRRLGAPVLLELLDVQAIDTGSSVSHDEARWATRLARRDVNTMQTLLVGGAQHRGASARMPFRRNLYAVLFAASLLSACSANGSTGEEQVSTGQPTSVTSVTPQATRSPSPGASSPSLNTTSPRISSPSPSMGTHGPGTSTSPTARRLCDTKVESANPVLRGVRFGRHDTFDRLAFDFCKPADTTLTAGCRQAAHRGRVRRQGHSPRPILLRHHADPGRRPRHRWPSHRLQPGCHPGGELYAAVQTHR